MDIEHAIQIAQANHSQQKLPELQWLLNLCELYQIETVLEIGSHQGGTAKAFKTFARTFTIDCTRLYPDEPNLTLTLGDSHSESISKCIQLLTPDGKFDLVFIDGDHSYEGAKKDYQMYLPLAKKAIAFHDIVNSEYHRSAGCFVSRLWEELKLDWKTRALEFCDGDDWGGIGVVITQYYEFT
jgi:predicted O-methyltransferase YrrM